MRATAHFVSGLTRPSVQHTRVPGRGSPEVPSFVVQWLTGGSY
jgi:hypothetical protein